MILKIKDGVVLKRGHLLPHMTRILDVALVTAPVTTDGAVWVTEGYRKIRTSLDMHELCGAFDFRCRNILEEDQMTRESKGRTWAIRMQEALGSNYDVIAHGEGDNFHIHAEYDPR